MPWIPKLPSRRTRRAERVGVAWTERGFALACIAPRSNGTPELVVCEEHEVDAAGRAAALAEAVQAHGLQRMRARLVLASEAASLRLLDAPLVPEEEIAEAVRWLLQDGLDFDVERAALDVISFAGDEMRNRQARVHVAVTREEAAREAAEAAREAGLRLEAVEIRESALLRLPGEHAGAGGLTAVLRLDRKQGLLAVGIGERLLLGRPVPVGVEALEDAAQEPAGGGEGTGAFEELALDLQRSLDWLERTYDQGSVARLWVAPAEGDLAEATHRLGEILRLDVRPLELAPGLACDAFPSQALQARCLEAVAAAGEGDGGGFDLRARTEARTTELLSPARMAVALGAVALVLAGAAGLRAWRVHELAGSRATAEAETKALGSRVEDLQSTVAARQAKPATETRIDALREAREARRRLLGAFADARRGAEASDLSPLLAGLAASRVPDVWLHEIHLRDAGRRLDLRGSTLEPDGVARLLRRIEAIPALAGRGFETLRVERGEDAPWRLDFRLGSRAGEESP